ARQRVRRECLAVVRRDEAWIDDDAAGPDLQVVVTTAVPDAAKLDDPQAAPLRAVHGSEMLERDHAVDQAVDARMIRLRGLVVEKEHGARPADEELLQS